MVLSSFTSPSGWPVEWQIWLLNAIPSLLTHYRCLTATTNCSAPVSCIGTLSLKAVDLLRFSLSIKTTGSRSSLQKPKSESRLLYADCHLSNNQVSDRLVPRYGNALGFDSVSLIYDASTEVQVYSSFWSIPAWVFSALWLRCSLPQLFTAAALSGLKPALGNRLRRALLHLL